MRDVIEKMLAAEAEAKRLVADAEAEADRIRADARRQAQERADTIRTEARAEADRLVHEAAEAADRDRAEALRRATETIDREIHLDDEARARAVDLVVWAVTGQAPQA